MKNTFESDQGFYRLKYPRNFERKYADNILSIFPRGEASALTISSYFFEKGIDDRRFEEVFKVLTKEGEVAGEKTVLSEDNWIYKSKEEREGETLIWTKCLNRCGKVLLYISINMEEDSSEELMQDYQEIFQSVENLGKNFD
jgi:hypothetical protein